MRNIHVRTIDAPAAVVGPFLDGIGQDGDRLWPSPAWVPMRLDRPVQVGADGGHGPIRYWVTEYEPGRRVRFAFHPEGGIEGYHELSVEPLDDQRCTVRHVLDAQPRGAMRVLVPLAVRWAHDAVLEDLLDNAERAATGTVRQPARWSPWVRFLRRFLEFPKPTAVPIPADARLARAALAEVMLEDAWQLPMLPGMPRDPAVWADAIFRDPPRWVGAALLLRNQLVRLVGIEQGDRTAFDTVDRDGDEILLGTDAGHLDFRASILTEDHAVTLSTVVTVHNRRGRLYMALVWRLHPLVVRSMFKRAFRTLAADPERGAAPQPPWASATRRIQ
ncbi:DUF2867 domain-containing protein [Phytoactinopolyspora halotolerans]|uniref:DUF2867 domain-containing protein n=1 Tax=Phytoactinopolyspora halotolerans TaxID=1981512 RepID=A0A6L9S0N6_9ACTN|nr:DUF2867 domain-containing protein [Phytoactinopolyspora halotolerans]NED98556.1 DUF2867 domain-containing protein [Phytoactinopolyspora halotolerans]